MANVIRYWWFTIITVTTVALPFTTLYFKTTLDYKTT